LPEGVKEAEKKVKSRDRGERLRQSILVLVTAVETSGIRGLKELVK